MDKIGGKEMHDNRIYSRGANRFQGGRSRVSRNDNREIGLDGSNEKFEQDSMRRPYYERLDIILVDFGLDYESSVIGDFRPAIVISNTEYNRHSPVMQVLPLTKKLKSVDKPYHIFVDRLDCEDFSASGVCLVEQITTVDRRQVRRKIARVVDEGLAAKIDVAILDQLDIPYERYTG